MNIYLSRIHLAIIVTALLFLVLVIIAYSPIFPNNPDLFSLGITADLLIVVPVLYFLLIRKTKIPNTSMIPVILLGMIIGSYILPDNNQQYLNLFKQWILPIIEISVLIFVIIKIRKEVNDYKYEKIPGVDFFTALKKTCYELLPQKVAMPFAMEVGVFYYSFFCWGSSLLKENEFSYHKKNGALALLMVFIFLILVETFVFHLLLVRWSTIAAWILSALSLYTALQVFGLVKSIPRRPIIIEKDKLYLRYGLLNEVTIRLDNIAALYSCNELLTKEIKKLSPLGKLEEHNVIIELKEENFLSGLYGLKKPIKKLAFYVDEKDNFIDQVRMHLQNKNYSD